MTKLHIAVCSHKPGAELDDLLDSLGKCRSLDRIHEIWLVENGYESPLYQPKEATLGGARIRHVCLPEPGVARARQWLVDEIQEGLVIFLDSDITVEAGWVEAYAQAADRSDKGVIFGGPLDVAYESPPPDWLVPYLPRSARGWNPKLTVGEVPQNAWFMGGNFAAYCEDISSAGGFDIRLGPGAQCAPGGVPPSGHEVDIQKRMQAQGTRLEFLPAARVTHKVPSDACTPEWLLQRVRRNAIRQGLLSHDQPEKYPVPSSFDLIRSLLKYCLSVWPSSDERQLVLRRPMYKLLGYYDGRRAGRAGRKMRRSAMKKREH